MLVFNLLELEEKKELMKFLWKVELTGKKRESMWAIHRGKIRTLIETFDDGMNVGNDVLDDVFEIFEFYIPELKTIEGQLKLGIEKRFGDFLREPVAFLARVEHLGSNGGGEVISFSRTKKK